MSPTYRATLVRLISADDQPGGPGYRDEVLDVAANGSLSRPPPADLARRLRHRCHHKAFEGLESFTLQCCSGRPRRKRPGNPSSPSSTRSIEFGWGLFTNGDGHACFFVGDGNDHATVHVVAPEPLIARQWYLIAGSYDAAAKELKIVQRMIHPFATIPARCEASVSAGSAGLRAQCGRGLHGRRLQQPGRRMAPGSPAAMSTARIERPVLARRLLDDAEAWRSPPGRSPRTSPRTLVLAWDFSLEIPTDRLVDISGNGLDGTAVNLPIRALRGHNWNASEFDWTKAPEQWGAMHFVEDAIYDCGWQADFEVDPARRHEKRALCRQAGGRRQRAGIHPLRRAPAQGQDQRQTLRPRARRRAISPTPISTKLSRRRTTTTSSTGSPGSAPTTSTSRSTRRYGVCMYGLHADGTGPHYSSRLRPIAQLAPGAQFAVAAERRHAPARLARARGHRLRHDLRRGHRPRRRRPAEVAGPAS